MAVTMQKADLVSHDRRFARFVDPTAPLEVLHTGTRFGEGPAYFPAHRMLLWSDIPSNRILRFDEATEQVTDFRLPSNFANGNTRDFQGRLVTCEHGARRVVRLEHSGAVTVLSDSYSDQRLNSPNDVVVSPDGSVWFSDPTYGIDSDYEGHRGESEIGASHVYRVDPETGETELVADDFHQPNGLAFNHDFTTLYIVDSGFTHDDAAPRHIRRFDVKPDLSLSGGDVIAECKDGIFDGLRVDRDGRVWTSAGQGIQCLDPDGTVLGELHLPEVIGNLEFGGPQRNELYICGAQSLYRLRLCITGARPD
ncbi:MAG: SMP-30/gluconolactonase/LRE family protein [Nostocoides sp.]